MGLSQWPRAVRGEGLDRLDVEIVGSNPCLVMGACLRIFVQMEPFATG
jgi:hypothetical protein